MKHILAVLALLALACPAVSQEQTPKGWGHPRPPSRDHWYDRDCCSNRDCEPIPEEAVSVTQAGQWHVRYINFNGALVDADVPRARIRPSRDGRFHACSTPVGNLLCFYIPLSG